MTGDEIPRGLLRVVNASDSTIAEIKRRVEAASKDPDEYERTDSEGGL